MGAIEGGHAGEGAGGHKSIRGGQELDLPPGIQRWQCTYSCYFNRANSVS